MPRNITESMAGCWLEDQHGWHNAYRLIDRAEEFGFRPGVDYPRARDLFIRYAGEDFVCMRTLKGTEHVTDLIFTIGEEALDYLEDHAPAGYVFVQDMGGLYLWREMEEAA